MVFLNASQRYDSLIKWLEDTLNKPIQSIKSASNDASFRRYYRVHYDDHRTCIAVDSPPEYENGAKFVAIATILEKMGIRVPRIKAKNLSEGFFAVTDLGNETMLNAILSKKIKTDHLYKNAMNVLLKIQVKGLECQQNLPLYSKQDLLDEMQLFIDWYCFHHLQISPEIMADFDFKKIFNNLADHALSQKNVFVHRDFHSRNIILSADAELGVLDFQDAVSGPITYDLVSLLKDCYIKWPDNQIDRWIDYYYQRLVKNDLVNVDINQFKYDFDLMGIQRHLKAIGIFCRLNYRDGKENYLLDIPRILEYVAKTAKDYPLLNPLQQFMCKHVF